MNRRFLIYFLVCFAPLFLLALLNYWNGVRSVNATIGAHVQRTLDACITKVDGHIQDQENELRRLALSKSLKEFVASRAVDNPPSELQLDLASNLNESLISVSVYDQARALMLSAERAQGGEANQVQFRRTSSITSSLPTGDVLVTKDVQLTLNGAILQNTVPIVDDNNATVGFLVGYLNLKRVFSEVASVLETDRQQGTVPRSMLIVLDNGKRILYHADHSLEGQPVSNASSTLASAANEATSHNNGIHSFSTNSGQDYLVAFAPLPRLNLTLGVASDRSLIANARNWGIVGFVLTVIGGLIGAVLLQRQVLKKASGIERVTEDVSAIAKGEIDRRIVLKSSDDARGLADNINVVTERLREQIAREEESRQFESFVRLSAMLTHDLKNAIEALSLTVGNMERHFDNEQFRVDALKSLTSATDKLKAIVTRLTRPITSLSGEHKRPVNADLVPMLKRVVAMTAEPLREKHTIEIKLPTALYARVDVTRMEEVAENLVLNALEAMTEKGGKLRIEAALTSSGDAMFSVSDTGPGMSQAFIKSRLFRPFSTTKRQGVGLGLYTCREVVQAHSGHIEVESVEGAGTTFRVVLPSAPQVRRN